MKKSVTLISLLMVTYFSFAQTAKYSNEFLSLGVGARALAMSNAMVSLTDDVHAAYWNPAGLTRLDKKYEFSLMHSEYFAGIAKYDYAGIAYKIDDKSAVALSYLRFGVDNIMNTTDLIDNQGNVDYNRISYFSAADNAFLISYARNLGGIEGLSVGANAKVIRRSIGDFAGAWGFGLDAGIQYKRKGWQVGLMARDVTSTFNAWNYNLTDEVIAVFQATGNEIPKNSLELTLPKLILGAGKKIDFNKGWNATVAADIDFTFDGKRNTLLKSNVVSLDPHLGLEVGYKKIVAVRAGIGNYQKIPDFDGTQYSSVQLNFGLGIGIKDIVYIDYAFTDLGNLSIALYSHLFSIKVALDKFHK
ncbi:MAG: PorV/PorQ family protein [Bacteroidales bacterium]|jgi:hypothetical protein|nr:PorV/PorQ family protein [Bacteroidales bacterium]